MATSLTQEHAQPVDMNPPFAYYGGKRRIGSKLLALFPDHKVYVEPFAGSATMLFYKGFKAVTNNHNYREYINDTNKHIATFFRVLRDDRAALLDRLRYTECGRDVFYEAKGILKSSGASEVMTAWAFFVAVSQGFGHKPNSGWAYGNTGKEQTDTFIRTVAMANKCSERIRRANISNWDGVDCIKRLDSEDTFFYIDPPYVGSDQGHYKGYTENDFNALIDTLKTIKGSFVLSSYAGDVPSEWERFEIAARMTVSRNKDVGKGRTEVAWRRLNARHAGTSWTDGRIDQITAF